MRQWVQVTSGRGPAECAWVVPRVVKCLSEESARAEIRVELLESVEGPFLGTLDSALVALDGEGLDAFLTGWTGSILWIGTSPFRPTYRRKNWFVGVEALASPLRFAWSEKEVVFETMRAWGPGGQHVNKTESAVRVTHLPTKIAVTAREERSQQANRKLAMARLAEILAGREKESERGVRKQRWSQHNQLQRGNPVRVYEGERFALRV